MKKIQLAKPHLIVLTGIPASGKTTFGEQFADTFQTPFISTEKLRTSGIDTKMALNINEYILDEFCKSKQTILFEEQNPAASERRMLSRIAKKYGYEIMYVWVQTDPNTAKSRALKKSTSLTEAAFDEIVYGFTKPPKQYTTVVISGMHTYPSQAKAVLKKLAENNLGNRPESQPARRPIQPSRRVSS